MKHRFEWPREVWRRHAEAESAPQWTISDDAPLRDFAAVFARTDVSSLDVNRRTVTYLDYAGGRIKNAYELLLSWSGPGPAAEQSRSYYWDFVGHGQPPVDGFRRTSLAGAGPRGATAVGDPRYDPTVPDPGLPLDPPDLVTVLLLLVTSNYLHLSGLRATSPPQIRGAFDLDRLEPEYGFAELDPSLVPLDRAADVPVGPLDRAERFSD